MEKEKNVIYCDFGGVSSPISSKSNTVSGGKSLSNLRKPKLSSIVYSDFDGTVTKEDSVNKFLSLFADKEWLDVEEEWVRGEIGSRDCLLRQVNLIPELSMQDLADYIDSIEIDESFIDFYKYVQSKDSELVIVSDGFDLFIKETLRKYNLKGIRYYANTLVFKDNRLSLEFHHGNPYCKNSSGVCKCSKTGIKDFCYIGDGHSDICISKKAGTLFAKKNLKKYCDETKIDYFDYETFEDVLGCFMQKGEVNAKLNYINN